MTDSNKKQVKVQRVPAVTIKPLDKVKVISGGENHLMIKWQEKPTHCHVKVLPGRKYMVLSTKEVKDMAFNPRKRKDRLRKTFEDLRWLIRSNFTEGGQNQVLLTLTYPYHQSDTFQALDDFEDFWKRLKYHLSGHKLDYISVLEPQGSGSWHFHVMIKSDQSELWIDKHTIKRIWGQKRRTDGEWTGAYIERLKSDDVGAYYVSYFTHLIDEGGGDSSGLELIDDCFSGIEAAQMVSETDHVQLEHNPEGTVSGERMELLKKAKIKGARLKYYPKDVKLYRCSRGITRPKKSNDYAGNMSLDGFKKVFSTTTEIQNEEGESLNTYQKEYFKRKSK
jgi:hypothetical protein